MMGPTPKMKRFRARGPNRRPAQVRCFCLRYRVLDPGSAQKSLSRTVTDRNRVFLASKVRDASPSGKRGTLPPEGDPEIPKMRSRAHPHSCLSPQNAPGPWSLHAVISAVFERSRRLRSDAWGFVCRSVPASGVMSVEGDPYLGRPSRSRHVAGPPARRKSRSEKVKPNE